MVRHSLLHDVEVRERFDGMNECLLLQIERIHAAISHLTRRIEKIELELGFHQNMHKCPILGGSEQYCQPIDKIASSHPKVPRSFNNTWPACTIASGHGVQQTVLGKPSHFTVACRDRRFVPACGAHSSMLLQRPSAPSRRR